MKKRKRSVSTGLGEARGGTDLNRVVGVDVSEKGRAEPVWKG